MKPPKDTNTKPKHIHDVIGDVERQKKRKKERKTTEAMEKRKYELPQVGFEPMTLCTPNMYMHM